MNRQNQMAIRASLKNTLFSKSRRNLKQNPPPQNSSPPMKNSQPKSTNQQFRHFSDIYEYGPSSDRLYEYLALGEGAHGIVKKCYKRDQNNIDIQDRTTYAVKIFRTGDTEIINTIRETFHINRTLNDLNCVVKALDLFINSKKEEHHLVMEYCPFLSLEQRMGKLSVDDIQIIALNLAQSIKELHQRGICHRDLKPDNILIGDNLTLKLIDFGVSKRFFVKGKVTKKIDMWTRTGSLFYQAPEIQFLGGGYNEKVDIWSIGIILYQLLVGQLPFQQETVLDTIEMIRDSEINVKNTSAFKKLNPLEQDLLKRLLKKDPEKRLSAEDFSLHPWLQKRQQKKSTKSFDDCDIQDIRKSDGILQQSQISIQKQYLPRSNNPLIVPIQEEKVSSPLKLSWNIWDTHVHYVPQDLIQIINLYDRHSKEMGSSEELINQQQKQDEIGEFQVGLMRTTSEHFDQL
ncbi:unnamed protein product (macronuclear) [Paramecium tetraurelia]|uniref:Protein kinase domain-containing protein n=1 Tax=Paramecium tetraurelia TaxID=5888 RepID=A0D0U7_PARTE|nr:uncharacterized protein GSPATT00012216001 [Paramecium tetraurelia]CAK76664.1 unnamed protein product [Paramecium tetraurelia]|eukprot:XP_001444061.1 hypothetical protein (macronuclear) [Paramecium tetraurelia strain d4-2]